MEITKRYYNIVDFINSLNVTFFKSLSKYKYIELAREWGTFGLLQSCFIDGPKVSVPYAWELSIGNSVYIGRTIEELQELTEVLKDYFELGDNKRIIIYDANIAYNFHSYIRHIGPVVDMFAKEENQPLTYIVNGLNFRDFNILCGEKIIEDDFFTNEIITENSFIGTGERNILISLVETINERIEQELTIYKNIGRIPLTNTGRAKKELRKLLKNPDYRNLVKNLTMEPEEMELLKRSFVGGLVVAREDVKGQELEEVASLDIISSYLASACSHMFPMSKGKQVIINNVEEAHALAKSYLWVGYIKITGLSNKYPIATIQADKCFNAVGYSLINNKIATAQEIILPVTCIDFEMIEKFYNIKSVHFGLVYRYEKDYLPKEYIETVLKFYDSKTKLKGIKGKEIEYTVKKSLLNASCYGVMVQDPMRNAVTYDNGKWVTQNLSLEEYCIKYNNDKQRFAYYPWGVFVAAYSRFTLLNGILSVISDFAYSDTDSIKLQNFENHKSFFEQYNKWIASRIDSVCDYYEIDKKLTRPRGKQLGAWDFEGIYPKFETVGEKRYISIDENGEFKATIAGVNSNMVSEYLGTLPDAFESLRDDYFVIPKEHTGRANVYLIKTERRGIIKDRDGQEHAYYTKTGVYQEYSDYNLGLAEFISLMTVEKRSL